MNQNGRKSAAALAVVEPGSTLPTPTGLSAGERAVWLRSVKGKPADYFGTEHVAMLVTYCRLVCRLDIVDQQVREFQPEWMATEEGLKRFDYALRRQTADQNAVALSGSDEIPEGQKPVVEEYYRSLARAPR